MTIRKIILSFFTVPGLLASGSGAAIADAPKAPDAKPPIVAVPVKLSSFKFKMPAPSLTSAGVYDAQDHLVQVLWTMKPLPGGKQTGTWDGKDQFGQAVPPGKYHYEVVVSHAVYTNVGAIGNSGKPSNTATHVPANLQSVATDSEGGIYTANGWDESGADFKKWDASGNSVYDAQYQMRNGNPNGAPYRIATDDKYLYCAMGGWDNPGNNHKQQIQRFRLSDGKAEGFPKGNAADGHIQVYEWPEKLVPAGTPPADAGLMYDTLRSLAATSNSLYVADPLGARILCYNKVTGEKKSEFPAPLPQALAIDAAGRLWVGGQHHNVTIFSADGKQVAQPITDVGEIEELAFGQNGKLFVADSGTDQVKIYVVSGDSVKLDHALGHKAKPGDRAADAFYHLTGVSVDPAGNIVTTQTEPYGGARLAKWDPSGKLLWEQFGAEFVSLGNYGALHPDDFYSMSYHRYKLGPHQSGGWVYTANELEGDKAYKSDPHGVPRILRLGVNDFYFLPSGDGMQVFRLEPNGLMHLASLVGGNDPNPEGSRAGDKGQWTWHDSAGTGQPAPGDIQWFAQPGKANYNCFGMDVDMKGNIWFANINNNSIWLIPLMGLDPRGNPMYDWTKAREIIAPDKSPPEFRPTIAQPAPDGTIYAYGWSKPWPSPSGNGFWMGGTTLVRFDQSGRPLWAVPLPAICVGLDVIPSLAGTDAKGGSPSGGCIVGAGWTSTLYHYSPDGLLIGSAEPGAAMSNQHGAMDNHASVAVNRDPRDGILDVFTEDDYVLRIGWFRIDDHDIHTLAGSVALPR